VSDEQSENIYIFYAYDMLTKYPSFASLSNILLKRNNHENTIKQLYCYKIDHAAIDCKNARVDLNSGVVDGNTKLSIAVFVEKGYITNVRDYKTDNGLYLIAIMNNKSVAGAYLVDKEVYESNLVQMYILGNYDKRYFKEIINDYPHLRVFKINNLNAEE
jgi:hypothetical protein